MSIVMLFNLKKILIGLNIWISVTLTGKVNAVSVRRIKVPEIVLISQKISRMSVTGALYSYTNLSCRSNALIYFFDIQNFGGFSLPPRMGVLCNATLFSVLR